MGYRLLGSFLVMVGLGISQITFSPQTAPTNGQQPTATTARFPLNGTVVNAATGAAVPRAVVRLQGAEPAITFTGDDGQFSFKDVPEGRAFISAQRPGFQPSGRGAMQQVTIGSSTSSVQVKLVPQSSLRGRVRNSDGEPIEGLQLRLFRRQVLNGVREWMPGNAATTDETGAFEIDDVQPGAYLLQNGPHPVFSGHSSVVVDGRHFPDLYPEQYYPNAPDRSAAQPIQVQPGADAQIDITLSAVPSYSVSGTLVNSRNAALSCENADGDVVSVGVRMDRNNGFTLNQVPTGSCTLHARTGNGPRGSGTASAEMPITVGSADLTGIQVSLEPALEIPLVIAGSTSSANPAPNAGNNSNGNQKLQGNTGANVQLLPSSIGWRRRMPMLQQNGDSKVFAPVMPGTYRVSVQAFGGNCVASVSSGSVDLLRSDLTVAPGGSAAPIVVTLRNDCGTITAKVGGPNPNDPIAVLVMPDGEPARATMLNFVGGSAQIPGLTPGDYILYAAPDLSELAYADPEAMKGISGQKVSVTPNANVSVQIEPSATPGSGQ